MNLLFVSDEMLQMVANGEELHLPEEISINEIAEFSASKLLEARQRIRELEEQQRWIPVSERLPDGDEPTCERYENEFEWIGYYWGRTVFDENVYFDKVARDFNRDRWFVMSGSERIYVEVTHWRPLPEPPEPVWWAECEICGATRDCGDMQEVEDDVGVCDLKGTDCLDEWHEQKVEEE